ncbi:hypothetical protein IEQ34_022373 [Dendrobium chrysotoxum]|uniref:Survival Motor Neuron Gemin2-binding domain-containing protein n=1 Tax=Dendrobium chrysotoxum TaxID=161865 RepID=A0AAV7FYN5_DENCH|nr:hypothetical protein IEQ34_022373 [Dendrobium chrysotoxum]
MMKGTELWDDSALINAFDAAMKSYKEMHTEYSHERALDREKDDKNNKKNDTVPTEEAPRGRQIEPEDNNLDVEITASSCNNAAATSDPFTQEDIGASCSVPGFNPPLISDHPCVNPKFDGYSDHQNLDFNELLKQYNELEHKKEKIVEQLWQANYWNYQTQLPCPTTQQQQVSVSSGSENVPNNSCPWCAYQCPMASALSVGHACCPLPILCCSGSQVHQEAGGAHCSINHDKCSSVTSFPMNTMNHLVQEDGRAVETGPMPVELVKNSVKEDLAMAFNLHEERKTGEDDSSSKDLSSTSGKTDLNSVINAWYWAGYHTGRYLLEQEQSGKQSNNTGGGNSLTVSEEKGDVANAFYSLLIAIKAASTDPNARAEMCTFFKIHLFRLCLKFS